MLNPNQPITRGLTRGVTRRAVGLLTAAGLMATIAIGANAQTLDSPLHILSLIHI